MNDLFQLLDEAVASGNLLAESAANIRHLLASGSDPVARASISELANAGAWTELNDRFFRTLAFGTGGLRGRTIGRIVTSAERGTETALGRPQHPCIGTNAMNRYNISRATQGLVAYLKEWMERENIHGKPKIAVAHDTRHFSREFAELTAGVAVALGCDAYLFEAPRSTPELSFAVRYTGSHAGIVITASHNPPHDNGYKCYFADGAQVVEPHASGIIQKVNAVVSEQFEPVQNPGVLSSLGVEIDEAYRERLESLVLDPELAASQKDLKIVYTPIHGTGGEIIVPMMKQLGFTCLGVDSQNQMDGRFPTVKSPNPENAEALTLAVEQANQTGADLVIATDPDADRMGIAARNSKGEMQLFTGNQIGSLMGFYRISKMIEKKIITDQNRSRCVLIKTFVTTDLQKAIANGFGIRCVETLTGFKYIAEKLGKYEKELPASDRENYRTKPEWETRNLRLEKSSFYVFGGEESYGYSAHDFVRDKDANAAAVMIAEVAAYAKSCGLTMDLLFDRICSIYGYYQEKNGSLMFEGAEGAAKIRQLATSYAKNPPQEIQGIKVTEVQDFSSSKFFDIEGDPIPHEGMMIFTLENGGRIAVRPSGTEPKIKFYLFAKREPAPGSILTEQELAETKTAVTAELDAIWQWVQKDAALRLS